MIGADVLEWVNAALAVGYTLAAIHAKGRGEYAKGAYRMAWAVLFTVLVGVTAALR